MMWLGIEVGFSVHTQEGIADPMFKFEVFNALQT